MKLYGYWRSSAAYRVRIALYLKDISFDSISVHLVKDGGQQHLLQYTEINPSRLVPTLVDGDVTLNQSLAIIDYLEAKFIGSTYPLYPEDFVSRATVQALALDIACEVHPVNNLRVQQYLVKELGLNEDQKLAWSHHWMAASFSVIEERLVNTAGKYCFGDAITLADLCLVPQVYNANRFKLDMTSYPTITRIVNLCNQHPAFICALPENQDDAQ